MIFFTLSSFPQKLCLRNKFYPGVSPSMYVCTYIWFLTLARRLCHIFWSWNYVWCGFKPLSKSAENHLYVLCKNSICSLSLSHIFSPMTKMLQPHLLSQGIPLLTMLPNCALLLILYL